MLSSRSLLSLSFSLLLSACATASGTFVPLDSNHPASALAPEVPITDPSAALRIQGATAAPMEEPATSAGVPGAAPMGAYVCPMHAEVTANEAGRCPKCSMQLVPRAGQEPHQEEHPHDF